MTIASKVIGKALNDASQLRELQYMRGMRWVIISIESFTGYILYILAYCLTSTLILTIYSSIELLCTLLVIMVIIP